MADPVFPPGGGANSPGGAPTYDFAKISQKLHEIERIWAPRGGAHPKFYYVDLPLLMFTTFKRRSGRVLLSVTKDANIRTIPAKYPLIVMYLTVDW